MKRLITSLIASLLLLTSCFKPDPLFVRVEFRNKSESDYFLETNFPCSDKDNSAFQGVIKSGSSIRAFEGSIPNLKTYDSFCNYICKDYPDACFTIYKYNEETDSKGKRIVECPIREIGEIAIIETDIHSVKPMGGRMAKHYIYWKDVLNPE